MNRYAILTDSSCDLTPAQARDLGAELIFLTLEFDGQVYSTEADYASLDIAAFYRGMREDKTAITSAANAERFREAMLPHLEAGEDVLCLCFSSALSSTYEASCLAARELREEFPDRQIVTLDTLCESLGLGMLVTMAAERRAAGMSLMENAAFCRETAPRICHWFTVDHLRYLQRGGRVGKAAAVAGTVLGVKPVLHMDEEGRLVKAETVRGRKQSLRRLTEKAREGIISMERACVSHADCPEEAEELARALRDMGVQDVKIGAIGPVIGAHCGPGTAAVYFLGESR